jgi:Proprotein convertase P-domain
LVKVRGTREATIAALLACLAGAILVMPGSAGGGISQVRLLYDRDAVVIPNGHGAARMTMQMEPTSRQLGSVTAGLRIRHRRTQQLRLILRAPTGEHTLLSDGKTHGRNLGRGECLADPTGVRFTQFAQGAQALSTGAPPYVGEWDPVGSLSKHSGIDPEGPWTLIVKDTNPAGRHGKLLCGEVSLFLPPP